MGGRNREKIADIRVKIVRKRKIEIVDGKKRDTETEKPKEEKYRKIVKGSERERET